MYGTLTAILIKGVEGVQSECLGSDQGKKSVNLTILIIFGFTCTYLCIVNCISSWIMFWFAFSPSLSPLQRSMCRRFSQFWIYSFFEKSSDLHSDELRFQFLKILVREGARFSPHFFDCRTQDHFSAINKIYALPPLNYSHRELLERLYKEIEEQISDKGFLHSETFKTFRILLNAGTSPRDYLKSFWILLCT